MNITTPLPLLLTAVLAATLFCCTTPGEPDTPFRVPTFVASFHVEGMAQNAGGT